MVALQEDEHLLPHIRCHWCYPSLSCSSAVVLILECVSESPPGGLVTPQVGPSPQDFLVKYIVGAEFAFLTSS